MESYYEINVSKFSKILGTHTHVFATAPRSARNMDDAKRLYDLLREKFPKSEGYELQMTYWEGLGHMIDMEKK